MASRIPAAYLDGPLASDRGVTYVVRSMTIAVVPFMLFVVLMMCLMARSLGPAFLLLVLAFANRSDEWEFLYDGPCVRHVVRHWGIRVRTQTLPLEPDAGASSEDVSDLLFVSSRSQWHRLVFSPGGAGDSYAWLRSNDRADVERAIGLLNDSIGRVLARGPARAASSP
jgi:hypothetical protein